MVHNSTRQNIIDKIKTELSSDEDVFYSESNEEVSEIKNELEGKQSTYDKSQEINLISSCSLGNVVIKVESEPHIQENTIKTEYCLSTYQFTDEKSEDKTGYTSPVACVSDINLSHNEISIYNKKDHKKKKVVRKRNSNSSQTRVENIDRKSNRLTKHVRKSKVSQDKLETPTKTNKIKLRVEKKTIVKCKIAQIDNKSTKNRIKEFNLSEAEIPDLPEIIPPEREKFECIVCGFESDTNDSHRQHLLTHPSSECKCLFTHCHEVFSDGLLLETHFVNTHGEKRQFACIICNKAFRVELNRDRHILECTTNNMKTSDNVDLNLECEYCKACFKDDFEFKIHLGTHIQEGIYNCQLCKQAKLKDKETLEEHLLLHKQFECKRCDKFYISKRSLADHIRLKHTDKSLICSTCKRTFKDKKILEEHLKQHEKPKDFKCSQCDKAYSTKHCLKDHIRRKHTENGNDGQHRSSNSCSICDKRIKTGGMIRHMMFHDKVKPFVCQFCEKRFQDRAKLNDHLRIHYGVKPCICTECGKAFRTKSELRIHFITHITPGDPMYKDVYQTCPLCKQYTASIQKHMKANHLKESVICETCGKTFSSRASYSEHRSIHNNGPKHTCEICKRTFSRKWNMLSHRERHSNEKYAARYIKRLEEDSVVN